MIHENKLSACRVAQHLIIFRLPVDLDKVRDQQLLPAYFGGDICFEVVGHVVQNCSQEASVHLRAWWNFGCSTEAEVLRVEPSIQHGIPRSHLHPLAAEELSMVSYPLGGACGWPRRAGSPSSPCPVQNQKENTHSVRAAF